MRFTHFTTYLNRSALTMLLLAGICVSAQGKEDTEFSNLVSPAHQYWTRPLSDPFSKLIKDFESKKIPLDNQNELTFVTSLLKALKIPASSQMLVFSTTSLQLSKISPRNPRALFFNDDVYLGFIPGGKIEIISMDPQLGGIFYIFDIPRNEATPQPERAKRCMNCHSDADTRHVPGIVIKSVIPGPNGGSLNSFRREQTGHQIPLKERFGGWHLTDGEQIKEHWGNTVGKLSPAGLQKQTIQPGQLFSFDRYPASTSALLPQLVHEHQAGFVNRVLEAGYKYRSYLHEGKGRLSPARAEEMRELTQQITRYILFADEAPLPRGGIKGSEQFEKDFLATRKALPGGESLKDFDLRDHLFKYRCSYMIYSSIFQGLPDDYKKQIYLSLGKAISVNSPDSDYSYLPPAEKNVIRELLKTTLPK